MRTTSRLVVTAAVLGGSLALAGPASAQQACVYPFDCPIGGVDEVPATGSTGGPATGAGSTGAGSTGAGSTVATPNFTSNGSGSATSLPFTGGEVTLLALAGVAALGGGAVLVAAGRRRVTV